MLKLCLSTKFPHKEIRLNYGILRSDSQAILSFKNDMEAVILKIGFWEREIADESQK